MIANFTSAFKIFFLEFMPIVLGGLSAIFLTVFIIFVIVYGSVQLFKKLK